MSARYDRIELHWTADFLGIGKSTIELTPEDQDNPLVRALEAWWEEQQDRKSAAARAKNSGDPFTGT